jgi:hypothetical protein
MTANLLMNFFDIGFIPVTICDKEDRTDFTMAYFYSQLPVWVYPTT